MVSDLKSDYMNWLLLKNQGGGMTFLGSPAVEPI
jgi:hypothetical protein